MQVTGYQIREAIRRWSLRRDAAAGAYENTLFAFAGETKETPDEIVKQFVQAETAIAKLQAAQAQYNLKVSLTIKGHGELSLCEAVKRVGGLGRVEKMWRKACGEKRSPYDPGPSMVRAADQLNATRTLSLKDAMDRATRAASVAGTFRAAMAEANGTKIEIQELDAALLDE